MQNSSLTGSSGSSTLNTLFLIAAGGGFAATVLADTLSGDPLIFVPTAVVVAYGVLVSRVIAPWGDRALAEHAIDTVYFLGFLFTLFALVVLFGTVGGSDLLAPVDTAGEDLVSTAMTYIGISVTTSLAGILLRSMVRGGYLRSHPERTVDSVEAFLAERTATIEALTGREKEYLSALEQYVSATESFSTRLEEGGRSLVQPMESVAAMLDRQAAAVDRFEGVQQRLIQTAEGIHREASALPWGEIGEEMATFRTGVDELNAVLDGLITVLEQKVEQIS